MRNIPENVWQKTLNEDDWNFAKCDSDEAELCLRWELLRERAQAESNGTLPKSPLTFVIPEDGLCRYLRMARLGDGHWNKGLRQKLGQISKVPKGWIYHPDFPQLSYLSRRAKEKWKRVRISPPNKSIWLEMDAKGWNSLQDILEKAGNCPPIWWNEKEGAEITPLIIRWKWRDEDLAESFREWLKENRPKGEEWDERPRIDEPPPRPKNKGGAGSRIRQVKTLLKRLAAWRLIQRYKGNHVKAYAHQLAEVYLGDTYGNASEWADARKAVQAAIRRLSVN